MSQESLLVVGASEPKFIHLLQKLGYHIIEPSKDKPISGVLNNDVVDLIFIDARADVDGLDLCKYFRADDKTKKTPIVFVAKTDSEARELKELHLERIETIAASSPIATAMSKIATQLRLRKFAGSEAASATVADMNLALRDLTDRFRKELAQARSIQMTLLPLELPRADSFELAASYLPLDDVGGDWYFAEVQPSKKISLQIADITGHGISAALIGSMTRLAMAAARTEAPHELLERMNSLMTPQLPEGRFVTMASCLYDPGSGIVECARAGHPPPMVLHRDTGTVENLRPSGFALGFFDSGTYENVQTALAPNDVLLLLTDGISEGMDRADQQFGLDRVAETLAKTPPHMTANDIIREILKAFHRFTDGRQLKDDVTLLVLKRIGN